MVFVYLSPLRMAGRILLPNFQSLEMIPLCIYLSGGELGGIQWRTFHTPAAL
ncbi:MAG: hypothetical protein LBQ18_04265 [Campylobacteraceae bacterium]|nr:hypothetical protein [Campylobacteraceae bacterium]